MNAHTLTPAPDTQGAVDFLKFLDPDGRHDLAAIDPYADEIVSATFLPNEHDKMWTWIESHQGKRNLYYSVNRARDDAPHNRRLNTSHVGIIRAVGADIDAAKGAATAEHFRLGRERLKQVGRDLATAADFQPTVIVDTGGGLQPLWKLDPFVAATDNESLATGIGRTIQDRLKGDSVWDLPRILRLPGTINVLSPDKQKQGREPSLAAVLIEDSSGQSYPIEGLKAWAPPTAVPKAKKPGASKIDMDAVGDAACYDELPDALRKKFEKARAADRVLDALWALRQPAPEQKDESPSGFEFALAGRLKRAGGFKLTEYAQLVCVWEFRSQKHTGDGRLIENTWNHNETKGPDDPAGFDPQEIPAAGRGSDQWDEPADVWAGQAEPPDIPPGVLPAAMETWVADESERKGVAKGVVAVPALVVCAAAIPSQFRVQVKQHDTGHVDCPVLWGAIVGAPGSRKTPVLEAVLAPLRQVEKRWLEANGQAREIYDAQLSQWKTLPKDTRGTEPARPPERRKILGDITMEAVAMKLADNPSGLLNYQDELSQWAGNMDAYRAGKAVSRDQGFWLQAKGGGQYVVDRVSRDTVTVAVNAVHILGGIQPDVIRKLAPEWGGNGLMQRFLLVNATTARTAPDRAPNAEIQKTIYQALQTLSQLERSPFLPVLRFSPAGDLCRQQIVAFAASLLNQPDAPLPLRGWLEKLESEWARISTVFHYVEWATGPDALIEPRPNQEITGETAARAARFLVEFQYPHQVAFYRCVAGLGGIVETDAQWLAGHILHHRLTEISERDIDRAYPRLRGPDARAARVNAMRVLQVSEWAKAAGTHHSGHVNRWTINPAVHDGRFAERTERETARRTEAQNSIAQAAEARRAIRPERGLAA